MANVPTPFSCSYDPQFAQLLHNLNISLAVSTYQAQKVIVLSPVDEDKLIQLPRTFPTAMGIAHDGDRLAVATTNSVEVLVNSKALARNYPQKQGVYDAMYLPRATYHTGALALHDMAFAEGNRIIAVNTLFSCLCYIDQNNSFTPFWQPPFIDELAPEDRCHLNGMAMENGEIKYVTALGTTNTSGGWRENKMQGGIIMEYPSGRIVLDGLGMPHSPRIIEGKLYVLNSTQGELLRVDPEAGSYEVVCKLGGFARGMDIFDDYLFIGVSKLRHNSKSFADLPIAKTSFAGVIAVYLPYGSISGGVKYMMSVDEIYDVKAINALRPNLLTPDMEVHNLALSFPGQTFWGGIVKEK